MSFFVREFICFLNGFVSEFSFDICYGNEEGWGREKKLRGKIRKYCNRRRNFHLFQLGCLQHRSHNGIGTMRPMCTPTDLWASQTVILTSFQDSTRQQVHRGSWWICIYALVFSKEDVRRGQDFRIWMIFKLKLVGECKVLLTISFKWCTYVMTNLERWLDRSTVWGKREKWSPPPLPACSLKYDTVLLLQPRFELGRLPCGGRCSIPFTKLSSIGKLLFKNADLKMMEKLQTTR